MMRLRLAEPEDFEGILVLCEKFWTAAGYTEPFEVEHAINTLQLSADQGLLAVADTGRIIGFIGAVKSFSLGSTRLIHATEFAWYIEPEQRGSGIGPKLLVFMEKEAQKQGASVLVMANTESSQPEKVATLYEKLGYSVSETLFKKAI